MSGAPRIVIAAGGTAGHVVPALAVASALRAEGAEVAFIGGRRAEAQLVPAAGFPLDPIRVEGLSRSSPLRAIRALGLAAAAVPRARALLRRLAPDAVMGAGGYVAGPVGLAALTLGIPLVLTEADSRLGLANRMLAPFARRVCLAFPPAGAGVCEADAREGPPGSGDGGLGRSSSSRRRGGRVGGSGRSRVRPRRGAWRVTGRPTQIPSRDRGTARQYFGIGADETCLLVFGGSLGARSINLAAVEAFRGATFRVLHVSGRRDHRELAERELPAGYDLREYLAPAEFADALAAVDLVVARAGGSVLEIAARGLPAILVPYPDAAGDHQSANARWISDAGGAITISDAELSGPRLAGEVAALLADRPRLAAMASASLKLARPDAAAEVARELLEAARA
jgi:UDP-N-acetylglucosamine--N-acetylmuramyl-(pentapeptide) pyrophosphoryl-undecaprenol N-acetylglucosamine transferase